ncbi:hypothetical protein HZY62_18620 [Maribacter polysiphoniae]|uniref:Uncharacterized protein n=1 Tax=Maribacter polysiphoniae TaxID=429344 RepID=A0A316DSU5_9FLAO|nr:hypothetical protein [Maribacter polysiphoniae]MBD1262617.1 hypothetical protein [Maribacter polysiphoniae]PWK21181.1 hypothetical protein LX92_03982 [Maribacter polysiphoniae]
MNINSIPVDLKNIINPEQPDFIVKCRRNYPRKKAFSLLFFSLFWNVFVSIFVIAFIVPLVSGQEVHFTTNDVPTTGSLDNWEPVLVPALIIGLFVAVGIGMFLWALVLLFQKGGFFAGTETRLIKYRNGKITVKDWEQFSGNIQVKNKQIYGDLEMELRTGKMKSRNKGSDKFVPDIVYLSGVKNVFDIEKKCRLRIRENDPTPKITLENNID